MYQNRYTGVACDDRRIQRELQAMGAFDRPEQPGALSQFLAAAGDFVTWMRWKSEVAVNGYRLGIPESQRFGARTLA